ncbi:type II toxin-antitoxin system HicB family antitoxin [Erwinia sp.]|uniref:type II toxin-antitoxin system HicB family antitoxin n=1 Tax=Erwinia citreus TaxID=558 RepID=UPI003C7926A3
MFFSVGVETPSDENTAYGMIVPAFFVHDYGCFSAADSEQEIAPMVREAILLNVEEMLLSGNYSVEAIKDDGYLAYSRHPDYADYDSWFMIDVDLSQFEGKQQRINIALPDTLISRIDNRVKEQPAVYRDRSHFIAEAARHELQAGL